MNDNDSRVRLTRVEEMFKYLGRQLATGFEQVGRRFDDLENRIGRLDGKLEVSQQDIHDLDKRVTRAESEIENLRSEIKEARDNKNKIWVYLIIVGITVIIGAIAYFGITP